MTKQSKFNVKAFAETERDPVGQSEFEAAMRQVTAHSAKPETKSENREPTQEELNRGWRLIRR